MELQNGELIAAAWGMKNVHVIEKDHTQESQAIPFPSAQNEFHSLSLLASESPQLIACSTINSIDIYTIQQKDLKVFKTIALDFYPFRSVWISPMKMLVVFEKGSSRRIVSVALESHADHSIGSVRLDDSFNVKSCCAKPVSQAGEKCKLIFFDLGYGSLLFYEIS